VNHRNPTIARNLVATSQHLAAQAGLDAMRHGGNAIDAALATAIALTVVEPVSNGVGGDLYAIVWDGKQSHGFNASGAAPAAWSPSRFSGRATMPLLGWESVTVPGAVAGWAALSSQFGALPFARLFDAAVDYAQNGFPVSQIIASKWARELVRLKDVPGFDSSFAPVFAPLGRAPMAGETFRNLELARSLRLIADSGGQDFYSGELAKALTTAARDNGAALSLDDLRHHRGEPMQLLRTQYRDCEVLGLPPNTQGLVTLIALALLNECVVTADTVESVNWTHLQIEALKLAFSHGYTTLGGGPLSAVALAPLCDAAARQAMFARIDRGCAQDFGGGKPPWGGTVYVTTADAEGRLVSLIQSTFFGFGSGVVAPGTGIHLNDRGACFSLEEGHANQVAGGKRPLQTIIPGMVLRNNQAWASLGVTGGPIQPQGQVQLLTRMIDGGWDVQRAVDAKRWKIEHAHGSVQLDFETGFQAELAEGLRAMGHRSDVPGLTGLDFGGAFAISRYRDAWAGASDPRRDGAVVGF
jgi:gamma-glutamyltranspeptidase/glutathione hydrolase